MSIQLPFTPGIDYGNPVAETPLNEGLAAWWLQLPLNRGSSRLMDLLGRNHGTLVGGPTWQGPHGRPGGFGALGIASSSTYVNCGADDRLSTGPTNGVISFACWVRFDSALANTERFFASRGGGSNYNFGWSRWPNGWFATVVSGDRAVYNHTPTVGRWYHFAFTHTFGTGFARMYLDGNLVATGNGTGGTSDDSDTLIGASVGAEPFALDDLRFYQRVLADDEVRALYNDSRRGHPLTLRRLSRMSWFVQAGGGGGTVFEKSYSESLASTDTFTRLSDALRQNSENLGSSDTFTRLSDALRNLTESLASQDTFSRLSDALRAYSDTTGLSDNFSRLSDALRTYSDTTGLTDTYARLSDALRAYSDTLALIDTFERDVITPAVKSIQVIELLGITDAYFRISNANRSYSDTLGLADAYARLADSIRSYSDTIATSDTFARLVDSLRAVSESVGTSDEYSRTADANRLLSDTAGISDTFARLANALRSVSESLGTLDNFSRISDANRLFQDSLAFIDIPDLQRIAAGAVLRNISDIIGATDTFSRQASIYRLFTDTIGLADALTLFLATGVYPFVIDRVDFAYTQTDSQDFGYTVYDFIRFPGG